MPELPEVETIRIGLASDLIGRRFQAMEIFWAKSFQLSGDAGLKSVLLGAMVTRLKRRGKVLLIELDTKYTLMIHLKMTGQLILQHPTGTRSGGGHPTKSLGLPLPDSSTRVNFVLDDGGQLFFNDQRKFGWIKLVPTVDTHHDSLLARMGAEPLSSAFTLSEFKSKLARRGSPIKAVLLDQSTVAGLGNIYVDESLHLARIHPETKASQLTHAESKRLHQAIITIIESGIAHEGTTFRDFMNHRGERGNYFDHARVFKREGLACAECGSTITKTKVAGRGTHTCPSCQLLTK